MLTIYKKKNDNIFAIIINIIQNLLANLINGLILFFFFIDEKKRKKAIHRNEDIMNFTGLNPIIKTKKENGLQTPSKEKPTTTIEEKDNKGN